MARRGRSGGAPQQQEQFREGVVEDVPLDQHGNEIEETTRGSEGLATPEGNVGVPQGNTGGATGPEMVAPPVFDATGALLLNAIPGIVAVLQQLVHTQNGLLAERQAAPAPAPVPQFVPGAKQFRQLGPAYFDGTGGPLAAEEWMSRGGVGNTL